LSLLLKATDKVGGRLLNDNDACQSTFRHIFRFRAAADGENIPAGLGNHVKDIDANCFHGRPREEGEAAFLAFHGLTSFLLSAEGVAAGGGCEAEGVELTV
jgi:hypothetical protein